MPLNEFLRRFCNEKPDDWDEFIEFAAFCHNSSTHQSHNFTPYELTFAREAREPCVRPCEKDRTYGDYFTNLVNKLSDIQIRAHDRLIEPCDQLDQGGKGRAAVGLHSTLMYNPVESRRAWM